jgi:hypothetical protein
MTKPFSPESSAKAREQSEFQRELYKRKFLDDDHWVNLAREAGIALPMYYVRPSDAAVKSLLRRLRVSWDVYLEAFGWETTADFEKLNPIYSMRPLAGLILELWDEQQRMVDGCKAAANIREISVGDAPARELKYPRGVAKVRRTPLKGKNVSA